MKHLKMASLVICMVCVCAIGVFAGWERASGKTSWVNRPTPATTYLRDRSNDLVPAGKVIVYEDTTRIYTDAIDATTTNMAVNLGFWDVNSDGDLQPDAAVAAAYCTTNLQYNGGWTDVEWDINGDGDLQPKP